MKRIIFSILFLIFALSTTTVLAQDMNIIESKEHQFRFSYPEGWKFSTSKDNHTFLYKATYPKSTTVTIGVEVTPLVSNLNDKLGTDESPQENLTDKEFQILRNRITDTQLVNCSVVNFKGKKAILLRISLPNLVEETYIIFTDSYRYEIFIAGTSKGIEEYRTILDQSLNSFELLE